MKKRFMFLLVLVFLISGCSFDVQVVTPAPLASTLPAVTPIASSPVVPVSVSTDLPTATFTPVPTGPLFYRAYVVTDLTEAPGRSAFPVGTKKIYAVWNYQNMRAGLTVKREWYLDGKLWLQREEPWDFAKYGASGIMKDVSIYDENVGLPSGVYQLQIYIDGLLQPIGASTTNGPELWLNFEVQSTEASTETVSPDAKWVAVIRAEKRLIVRDQKGTPIELFSGNKIPSLAWFPDSQHILFIHREGSDQQAKDQVWIADVLSRETTLLVQSDTVLGVTTGLIISPDGHSIATTEGTRNGDACFLPLQLMFIEMGATYKGARVFYQKQFTGLPVQPDSSVYPSEVGNWQSNTQFVSPIKLTCVTDESLAGNYVFDLSNLTAIKK